MTERVAKDVFSLERRQLRKGDVVAPTALAVEPQHETVEVVVTVDDPTADPATDAKVMIVIEASDDGRRWYPISNTWVGVSGVMRVSVPINGRKVRVRPYAEMDNVIDIAIKAR